MRVTKIWLWR